MIESENRDELEVLNETEDTDLKNSLGEEEIIESIQGAYEDEFGENIEDDDFEALSNTKENQYVIIKIFTALAVIGIVAFVITRKIKKDKK